MLISLIGDSIRLHSEEFTSANIPSNYDISSPPENCESSIKVATKLDSWIDSNSDIVHINCGLHDIRHNAGTNSPVTTLKQYQRNLENIFKFLSKSNQTIIWSNSTPFNEAVHNEVKESRRYMNDLIRYNEASVELALKFGFHINDLFSKVYNLEYFDLLVDDGLHFNEKGNKLIGAFVAESIIKTANA